MFIFHASDDIVKNIKRECHCSSINFLYFINLYFDVWIVKNSHVHNANPGKVKTNGTVSCNTLRNLTHLGFIKDTKNA